MLRPILQLTLILTLSASALAQSGEIDGPYVILDDNRPVFKWTYPEAGAAFEKNCVDTTTSLPGFDGFHPETLDPAREWPLETQIEYSGVKRIVALSDIHGQYPVARKLLLAHGVIDDAENWTYGDGHLVIVGDVFDRGDQVNAALWLIHHLQIQAEAAGGRVHFLLGNHETMIMEGDVRYIHPRYLTTSHLLKTPYQDLYGPDTYLGRWLRSRPLTVRINDVVYVHGGFSKQVLKVVGGLSAINTTYHRYLMDDNPNLAARGNNKLDLLHGTKGPLWYRGYFVNRDFSQRDIEKILKMLDAEHLVVGHTSFNAITRYFGDRVYAVDSSIKFGSVGEVLLIEDGVFRRGTLTGEVLEAEVMK